MVEVATFGGGCFWCIETLFQDLKGVKRVESGYAGGVIPNPTYQQVCAETTGHAEVIQVEFDPSILLYATLLKVFFEVHDPTTLNRQGNDIGTQYRSIILYHTNQQEVEAKAAIQQVEKSIGKPVVTELVPFVQFFKAEAYHQNYYKSNPYQPYCSFIISPKVKKFKSTFNELLKEGIQ